MCNDPVMRASASGFCGAYFSRIAISPGISFSAIEISLRPKSANEISETLKSVWVRSIRDVFINLFGGFFQLRRFVRRFPRDIGIVDFAEVAVICGFGI